MPPNELPTTAAGRCSATASTNENGSVGSGDSPQPGRSGVTTSKWGASAATCRFQSRESPSAEWRRTTRLSPAPSDRSCRACPLPLPVGPSARALPRSRSARGSPRFLLVAVAATLLGRHEEAERARLDAKLERCLEQLGLAVDRRPEMPGARVDGEQLARPLLPRRPEQAPRRVDVQASLVEALALADGEHAQLILVVRNEYDACANRAAVDPDAEGVAVADDGSERAQARERVAATPVTFAAMDEARIQTERDVVQEQPVVDAPHVDPTLFAGERSES